MASPGFIKLFTGNLVPLHACLTGLTWILHDYFVTLEDEVRYIWTQKRSFGKIMFLWIRYYSIALLIFDVAQIHLFARPGIKSEALCVDMDAITRIVGAISLWSVEIMMQLRIYALFRCSRKIALINFILFLLSVAWFLWVLIVNAIRHAEVIKVAILLPTPGCPSIHVGLEWMQWIPPTAFEIALFAWALYRTATSVIRTQIRGRVSLYGLLLRDNIFYFFGITCLLVFNNLMVVGATGIPWFSYGPFHAAVGILTSRMLLNLNKAFLSDPKARFSELEFQPSAPSNLHSIELESNIRYAAGPSGPHEDV